MKNIDEMRDEFYEIARCRNVIDAWILNADRTKEVKAVGQAIMENLRAWMYHYGPTFVPPEWNEEETRVIIENMAKAGDLSRLKPDDPQGPGPSLAGPWREG